jgi:hypothetical protein
MLKRFGFGLASGAVGTAALNMATFLDMVVRGRPASDLPEQAASELTNKLGWKLSNGVDDSGDNRKKALGSLLGYVTGLGIGVAYGLFHSPASQHSTAMRGALVGFSAMTATDLPMALLGLTDPREWDAQSWLSDLLPHLVYGMCTAAAYEALAS